MPLNQGHIYQVPCQTWGTSKAPLPPAYFLKAEQLYMYAYIQTHTCTHNHISLHTYAWTWHIHVYTHIPLQTHTCVCAHNHVFSCACVQTSTVTRSHLPADSKVYPLSHFTHNLTCVHTHTHCCPTIPWQTPPEDFMAGAAGSKVEVQETASTLTSPCGSGQPKPLGPLSH
jgi:hypothetical protein